MIRNMSSKSFMMLSVAAIILLLGSMGNTEGSALKDAFQGALMGAGAVIAVAGLWLAGSKK
ncbi:hypothetical protein [Paenibacillus sp. 7523-1]|uniref:hypothetical protein n=1 Tax=Paenibacillus sp. 7523-1 TaxID=2022550 RepID=UPI000BA4FE44|nr:hypothetical protein [Paenibacillus sp. 7523-1]PAD28726.1 hypothetical protein CHH60_23790 [Paenibacillus sp. 7523-1]